MALSSRHQALLSTEGGSVGSATVRDFSAFGRYQKRNSDPRERCARSWRREGLYEVLVTSEPLLQKRDNHSRMTDRTHCSTPGTHSLRPKNGLYRSQLRTAWLTGCSDCVYASLAEGRLDRAIACAQAEPKHTMQLIEPSSTSNFLLMSLHVPSLLRSNHSSCMPGPLHVGDVKGIIQACSPHAGCLATSRTQHFLCQCLSAL